MPRIHQLYNADEEEELIHNERAVIIFFGSPGCGHCRAITPTYNSLSDKYPTITFAYVDCSQIKADNIHDTLQPALLGRHEMVHNQLFGGISTGQIHKI